MPVSRDSANSKGKESSSARSSDEEYYEPDEEELEEERQDAAVKLIQGLFRAKRARYIIRELVKANFVKEVDSLTGEYIYRNRRTGNVTRRKPIFLGSDDLDTPRYFAPPEDYDPGKSSLPQFALVITNWVFESPKIPNIPAQVEADHTALREILEHPYFSKFQSEHCFFVKNASSAVLKSSLASISQQVSMTMVRLKKESERRSKALRKERAARALERGNARRVAGLDEGASSSDLSDNPRREGGEEGGKQEGEGEGEEDYREGEDEEFDSQEAVLLVYVCTHTAEITKGKNVAGAYLVASDTSWKTKEELAKTALSLQDFAGAIATIQVRHKVVLLDVAHTKREMGGFKTRHLYPPRDLYNNLANRCGAVVVGSCRIGGTSEVDLAILRKEATKFWDSVGKKGGARNSRGGAAGSDTASVTSNSGGSTGSGDSGDSDRRRRRSNSEGATGSTTSGDADDSLADSGSESESHSCASATGNNKGSGSGSGSDGAGSGTSGNDGSQGRSGSGESDDGESLREGSTRQRGKRKNGEHPSRRRKGGGGRTGRGTRETIPQTLSGGRKTRGGGGGGGGGGGLSRWSSGVVSSKRLILRGSGDRGGGRSGNNSNSSSSDGGGGGDGGAAKATARGFTRKRERRQQHEERGLARACASVSERAIYEEDMSVFGRTVRDALSGECTENVHLPRVLVVDLYSFVRREFAPYGRPRLLPESSKAGEGTGDGNGGGEGEGRARKEAAAAQAAAEKAAAKKKAQRRAKMGAKAAKEEDRLEKEAEQLKRAEEEERRRTQVPVLAGPSISLMARTTVCASPSPPPSPMAPFHVGVTRTAVRLAWEDPRFPGAPPTYYEVEARGDLRNNGRWTPVFPPGYSTVASQPVHIPHRVPGLGLRYRVRACNHGGWGGFSDQSEVITTKPWLENLGSNATARAMEGLMRTGGARLVLERMRRYPSSLLVQECGFYQLAAEFNKGHGIPRSSLGQDVAVVVSRAMEAFSQVRNIQASGLLLLGWAARGKGGGGSLPAELVERCLDLVVTAEKLHSMDVAIKSHSGWARSNLQLARGAGGGAVVVYSGASTSEDGWEDTAAPLLAAEVGGGEGNL